MTKDTVAKVIRLHQAVAKEVEKLNLKLKIRIAEIFDLLAAGEPIEMPLSRPMPVVANGVYELRIKDQSGQYRIFYYTKVKGVLVIFHFFKKKSQTTPVKELKLAQKRLRNMI